MRRHDILKTWRLYRSACHIATSKHGNVRTPLTLQRRAEHQHRHQVFSGPSWNVWWLCLCIFMSLCAKLCSCYVLAMLKCLWQAGTSLQHPRCNRKPIVRNQSMSVILDETSLRNILKACWKVNRPVFLFYNFANYFIKAVLADSSVQSSFDHWI